MRPKVWSEALTPALSRRERGDETRMKSSGELSQTIGTRGESIFELAITDYSQFETSLFRPAFLSDRWPAIDFLVELIGVRDVTPYFLVQVKATRNAISKDRIVVELPPKNKTALARVPGPTYVVGVHEPSKRTFIRAVLDPKPPGIYDIPVAYELTPANLQVLYDEVKDYWIHSDRKPLRSQFV
jgi:hypothetical protein